MTAATLATRRREYLDSVADAALHEQDEAEARRKEAAEAARAAKKRHAESSRRRDEVTEARYAVLRKAEKHCRAMVACMVEYVDLGPQLVGLYSALAERPPPGTGKVSSERMIAELLSATMRPVVGHQARQFGGVGGMTFMRTWRQPDQSWTEEAITPVRRTEMRSTDNV